MIRLAEIFILILFIAWIVVTIILFCRHASPESPEIIRIGGYSYYVNGGKMSPTPATIKRCVKEVMEEK